MKQFEQHALKTSTFESHEKNEFVKDILFDVCSDFDRTFERTKKRSHDIGDRLSYECETEQTEIYGKLPLIYICFYTAAYISSGFSRRNYKY